jgi:hypothetical protein
MTQAFIEDPPYLQRTVLRRIDYWGLAFMAIWLATLQVVLDKGQQDDWLAAQWIRWALTISGVAMVAFVARELVTDEPIVNLRILTDRNFAIGTILITAMGIVLYATTAMLPLFLQTLLGYPALEAGLAISPRGLGALLAAIAAGRLIGIVDSRLIVCAGFGLLGLSGVWLSRLTFDVAWSNIAFVTFLNGLANPLIFIALSTMSFATLRREQMGGATGIYNLMRNLGGSVGISMATTLLARRAQVHQNILVAKMTPYDPVFQQRRKRSEGAHSQGGRSGRQQALGILRTLVAQALLAFVDNFRLITVLAICCIPLAVFLKRAGRQRQGALRRGLLGGLRRLRLELGEGGEGLQRLRALAALGAHHPGREGLHAGLLAEIGAAVDPIGRALHVGDVLGRVAEEGLLLDAVRAPVGAVHHRALLAQVPGQAGLEAAAAAGRHRVDEGGAERDQHRGGEGARDERREPAAPRQGGAAPEQHEQHRHRDRARAQA